MKVEYPRINYKSREDYMVINSLEEEIAAAENGYGRFEVTVLGQKPEGIKEPVKVEVEVPVETVRPIKEVDLLSEYEAKTGKKALWRGKQTKAYKEWLKGR